MRRYGALPVVRATGGLADTVFDVDSPAPPPEGQHPNGFTFAGADEASEDSALERAFRCQNPARLHVACVMLAVLNFSEGDKCMLCILRSIHLTLL